MEIHDAEQNRRPKLTDEYHFKVVAIPKALHRQLQENAKRDLRSVQSQIIVYLEDAVANEQAYFDRVHAAQNPTPPAHQGAA